MKKTYCKVIVAMLVISACKVDKKQDYLIFSGKIENLKVKSFRINNVTPAFTRTIQLNSNGAFSDTLSIESGYYSLSMADQNIPIYLAKDEDLHMVYNAKDSLDPLTFEGRYARENDYLFEKSKILNAGYGKVNNLYSLKEKDFVAKIRTIENDLKELANNSKFSPLFLNQELRNLRYASMSYLNNFESFHRYYSKDNTFVVSGSFPTVIPEDINNINDFNGSSDYRSILQSYYHNRVMEQPNINDDIYNLVYMNLVNKEATDSVIKNQLLFDNAKYGITFTIEPETFYNEFMTSSTNEEHKKEVTETYVKLQKTAKGKVSPEFNNYENYTGGTTSLGDLKGKYVYIDVWATWCGPCKNEIPYLRKIEEGYREKNIVFVSISLDKLKDRTKWRKMIKDKEMTGVQLIADKDWKSDFVIDYNILGIPRFILIDPKGQIVAASAPRPSNPKLIDLFTELEI